MAGSLSQDILKLFGQRWKQRENEEKRGEEGKKEASCEKEFPGVVFKGRDYKKQKTKGISPFKLNRQTWKKENLLVEKEYSYEEKRLQSIILGGGEACYKWEKENRLWEIQNGLVPLPEVEEKRQKSTLDWENEYSYEEKRLKSLLDGQGYDEWEKKNQLWEKQNGLVPLPEEKEKSFMERMKEINSRGLTEDEQRLRLSYLDNEEKYRLGLPNDYNPRGPGWDLAYYTGPNNLIEVFRKAEARKASDEVFRKAEERAALDRRSTIQQILMEKKQPCNTTVSPCVMSTKEKREKYAAQGRCLDGSYLTPYCKCDPQCCGRKFPLEEEKEEDRAHIWLAFNRQCRQSHCFDIDDVPGRSIGGPVRHGGVALLGTSKDFRGGKAELLMELANLAIQEYNGKDSNVFKYKVLKIVKANFTVSGNAQYWMTVKVLNLTLGTPIETFQIHAGASVMGDKEIYCYRLKEEAIVGLPSCEFCYGLLPEGHITGRKAEALEL